MTRLFRVLQIYVKNEMQLFVISAFNDEIAMWQKYNLRILFTNHEQSCESLQPSSVWCGGCFKFCFL